MPFSRSISLVLFVNCLPSSFALDVEKEQQLVDILKKAELYDGKDIGNFPINEDVVEIRINLGAGEAETTVFGADLTHEYVSENADYRS
jgi:glutamate N-acetyltransferase/amino-acid N-acetyltransferase